jgi:hypothetical protein
MGRITTQRRQQKAAYDSKFGSRLSSKFLDSDTPKIQENGQVWLRGHFFLPPLGMFSTKTESRRLLFEPNAGANKRVGKEVTTSSISSFLNRARLISIPSNNYSSCFLSTFRT